MRRRSKWNAPLKLMLSSLELNWVRNEDKSLVLPQVTFAPMPDVSGCYYLPFEGEVLIDDKYYDGNQGVIVLSTVYPDNHAGTIAHEWRHHWQFYHGWKYDGIGWSNPENYDEGIRDYFRKSYSEMDALVFEMKKHKEDHHDYWRSLII